MARRASDIANGDQNVADFVVDDVGPAEGPHPVVRARRRDGTLGAVVFDPERDVDQEQLTESRRGELLWGMLDAWRRRLADGDELALRLVEVSAGQLRGPA